MDYSEIYSQALEGSIKPPKGVSLGKWQNFLFHFSIIMEVWKEISQFLVLEDIKSPDCLEGETLLGYVRGFYNEEKRMEILKHLADCPRCSVRAMELRKEDWAAIPEYVAFIARELDLPQQEVERAICKISEERNVCLNRVAADLSLACGAGHLLQEEILRLASSPTQKAD